ncbi:MAG: transporter suffix domain-containing protein [Ectobacillus sp.]
MKKKAGILLIVLSVLLWAMILAVPFLPMGGGQKAALGAALVVAGEVFFWMGTLLVGKEVVKKWLKRKKESA